MNKPNQDYALDRSNQDDDPIVCLSRSVSDESVSLNQNDLVIQNNLNRLHSNVYHGNRKRKIAATCIQLVIV